MRHNVTMIDSFSSTGAGHPRRAAATPAIDDDRFELESRMVRPKPRIRARPAEMASILLVSPYAEDHLRIPRILADSTWRCCHCQNWQQAAEVLERSRIGVVLCERDLTDGSWRDVLACAQSQLRPPSVIVCSHLADEVLWAEVLNLGGYDVLIKPFDCEEVLRVVNAAWSCWKWARSKERARNAAVEGSTFAGLPDTGSGEDSPDRFQLRLDPWHVQ